MLTKEFESAELSVQEGCAGESALTDRIAMCEKACRSADNRR